ncbi:hypothetical protein ACSZOO_07450 [Aeromonas hydrophila]
MRRTIEEAIQSQDFFAFASGLRDDRFEGFAFGKSSTVFLDEHSLLISQDAAQCYRAKLEQEARDKRDEEERKRLVPGKDGSDGSGEREPDDGEDEGTGTGSGTDSVSPKPTATESQKNRFYGSVRLDAIRAKMEFATIMDEVVQNFIEQYGVEVEISIEINARSEKGFDANLQRAIKENCSTLKFGNAEFEE